MDVTSSNKVSAKENTIRHHDISPSVIRHSEGLILKGALIGGIVGACAGYLLGPGMPRLWSQIGYTSSFSMFGLIGGATVGFQEGFRYLNAKEPALMKEFELYQKLKKYEKCRTDPVIDVLDKRGNMIKDTIQVDERDQFNDEAYLRDIFNKRAKKQHQI